VPPPTRKNRTFAEAFQPKRNAFGFLRLALAVLVIFSHSFPLGDFGIDELETLTHGKHTIGLVAVAMFFVLSGFLITRSASRSPSVSRFLWHRFLRIFPGYWVCLFVSAFIFAPLIAYVEYGTLLRVFSAPRTPPHAYVIHNAALFHLNDFSFMGLVNIWPQSIAGLLSRNPVPHIINGSLWTLPLEVACYLGVAMLALFGLVRRGRMVFLASFVGLWLLYSFSYLYPESFARYLPVPALQLFIPLALSFSAGCLCFVYREKIPSSVWIFAACLALLALSLPFRGFGLATPILMTYAFLWLAFNLPFSRFEAKGDFSYGTYIYAFPIQQILSLAGVHEEGFIVYFGASLLITFMLAILSYRLVEAPCLRWKNVDPAAIIRARFGRTRNPAPIAPSANALAVSANP
jgi:peptidoglycan/LPS O-acetylase OafA/YrhL